MCFGSRKKHAAVADDEEPPPPPRLAPGPQSKATSSVVPPPFPPAAAAESPPSYYSAPPPPSSSHAAAAAGQDDLGYIAPPPGPPPSQQQQQQQQQQHDWEALVPDTARFPPPPSFFAGWDRSPAHNATEAEAEAGERWCAAHPLAPPQPRAAVDPAALAALLAHNPRLLPPVSFDGRAGAASLACTAPGAWECVTDARMGDSTILSYPPLYLVTLHSPLCASPTSKDPSRPRTKTIYYEVQLADGRANPPRGDICVALGFAALPYPTFRMPGWHRGSLAVHGDDGHRFVNDRWGGKSFTEPFSPGERLGLGMTFSTRGGGGGEGAQGVIETEVFFTRQGREAGRWDLHEETDAEQDLPVTGLEGFHDLSCAIGTYGAAKFDVFFDPERWMFRPPGY